MNEHASIVTVEVGEPPGHQLAAARIACKLSVADVARHLKLSPKQVEALEDGEYHHLPGAVFVRGFIRNYARLVRLDPASLLAHAEQQLIMSPRIVEEAEPSPDIPFPSGQKARWPKYAVIAAIALAVLALFEFYWSGMENGDEATVKVRPAEKSADTTASRSTKTTDGDSKAQRSASRAAAAPDKAVSLPAVAAAKSAEADRKAAPVERKPGEHLVRFTFEKDSWVEIRDRNGKRIFSQTNAAGTSQTVSGQPPLTLVIGNAPGVKLVHNGQPVNLAPYINVHVARLTLE